MTGHPLVSRLLVPGEVLDTALEQEPGKGVLLEFPDNHARERFRWRCYALMSAEAKASRRELDPASEGWGKHPWEGVMIGRRSKLKLWIGRGLDTEVTVVEGVTQEAED